MKEDEVTLLMQKGGNEKIRVPLYPPRVIEVTGISETGREVVWHLKVTNRGKLALI